MEYEPFDLIGVILLGLLWGSRINKSVYLKNSEYKSDLGSHKMSSIYYAGPNASTIIPVESGSIFPPSNLSHKEAVCYGRPRSCLSFAPTETKSVESDPSWNWGGVICSVVSMFCCVSFCGFFGLLCSVFAYVDHRTGNYISSRKKNFWGFSCAAVGMATTMLGALAVVLIFVIFYDQLRDILNSIGYYED
ncbi:hypothetical protein CAPTEDRAFT_216878 [Capitella teleta]|uniref:Uncharacterized protein n=1 Tax=Capitella teleta TaxID=283909 RepID=R7TPF2_CAPTE|nr:hypothetical protein CAPTEDRAFT_216878 [Capitella teleta]|eukprot:ELT92920.1 hypothetical protein CAPTEDRAFT_216878 [Capitella teleta]